VSTGIDSLPTDVATLTSSTVGETASSELAGNQDLRRGVRQPFRCIQQLGRVDGDRLPTLDEFQEVCCDNLSAGGVAMILEQASDFDTCVVALGEGPHATYFLARVCHVEPVYRVGCQFVRRLQVDQRTGRLVASPPVAPTDVPSSVSS
jgi:hypothetical protein